MKNHGKNEENDVLFEYNSRVNENYVCDESKLLDEIFSIMDAEDTKTDCKFF